MKKRTTKRKKPKASACPCPCAPAPRKRRAAPAYVPRTPPQFYSPLPIPPTEFHVQTVKRAVQDEFERYHSTPQKVQMSARGMQTEPARIFDSARNYVPEFGEGAGGEESDFGMQAAISEMRREGSKPTTRQAEQFGIETSEMESARRAFKPVPSMAQQSELATQRAGYVDPRSTPGFAERERARGTAIAERRAQRELEAERERFMERARRARRS